MTMAPETVEERTEVARDLRLAAQQALGVENERREWEITDASPRRKLYVLYNMKDGERIEVPKFVFSNAIDRRIPGTNEFAFTAFKDKAPQLTRMRVKCFLHPESPEREVLNEIGVFTECLADELRNNHARRRHAMGLHRGEWAAYNEYIGEQRDNLQHEQQRQQVEATLRLAEAASGTKAKG